MSVVRKACVIGAGFGGLALAIRLQSAGIETTLVEARDKPGGRAYVWQRDGFTFDAGPTVITDPGCLAELWSLSGQHLTGDVDLILNTPWGSGGPRLDGYEIRTASVTAGIPCLTTTQAFAAAVQGIEELTRGEVGVRSLQDLHAQFAAWRAGRTE